MDVKKMLRTFVDNTLRRGEDICVLLITNRDSDNVGDQVIEA